MNRNNKRNKKYCFLILLFSLFYTQVLAQKSPWKDPVEIKREQDNIDKYRKGDATILVVDENGNPIRNATVVIHQKTHEFKFGCNLFALHQLPSPELNKKYEDAFLKLFNFATIPFYWDGLEPVKDSLRFEIGSKPIWRRPPPDELVKWCESHDIMIKGHPLLYIKSKFLPSWIPNNDPEGLRKLAEKRMEELAERYGSDVAVWDVVNEDVARLKNPKVWHAAPHDFLPWAFHRADALFPKSTTLLINDETKTSHDSTELYVQSVKELLKHNVRLDGIGIQFHMHNSKGFLKGNFYPPSQMHEAYQKLGVFNKPLWITEITIHSDEPNGYENQAVIVEEIYKLWFSEPNMKGITWWNLGDGTAYGSENKSMGGILDSNMNPKPAFEVLDQLINHEWMTNLTLKTDKHGKVNFRGFHGKYTICVTKARGPKENVSFDIKSDKKINELKVTL